MTVHDPLDSRGRSSFRPGQRKPGWVRRIALLTAVVVLPLGLGLLLGATLRTSSHVTDAVFNGLHASGIAIAAAVALALVLPTVAVTVPTTLIGLASPQLDAEVGR